LSNTIQIRESILKDTNSKKYPEEAGEDREEEESVGDGDGEYAMGT
jgi:hypothetical protein